MLARRPTQISVSDLLAERNAKRKEIAAQRLANEGCVSSVAFVGDMSPHLRTQNIVFTIPNELLHIACKNKIHQTIATSIGLGGLLP